MERFDVLVLGGGAAGRPTFSTRAVWPWTRTAGSATTTRRNAAFAYIDPARPRPNLTILPDTLVDRLRIADGRATGAITDGRGLGAEVVVVAASAYGSPGILLRSG